MSGTLREGPSSEEFQRHGYDSSTIAKLARLGLVATGYTESTVDETAAGCISWEFMQNSPLARANQAAGNDAFGYLDQVMQDARTLSLIEFAERYPELSPYL